MHPFDLRHGVDTSGLMYADGLDTGHPHDRLSSGYYATAPSLFHSGISLWKDTLSATNYTTQQYAFFDAGCGKGRVLMMATQYDFRQVVGVELHPWLAKVASRNLRKWVASGRSASQAQVVNGDVLAVAFPTGPVLVYLFNSFEREMVQALLRRLVEISATRADPIDLLYVHPDYGNLVRQTPRMEWLADADIAFGEEDAAADVFRVRSDRCSIYRLPGMLRE
jgi:hypothetical protein